MISSPNRGFISMDIFEYREDPRLTSGLGQYSSGLRFDRFPG